MARTLAAAPMAAMLLGAAPAHAVSVGVEPEQQGEPPMARTVTTLVYQSGPRERSDVRVTRSGRRWTFTSRAARLSAGSDCRQRGSRRVTCTTDARLVGVSISMSSRSDRAVMSVGRLGPIGIDILGFGGNDVIKGPDYARAGDGAGRLSGGAIGLEGGRGDDRLTGGNGADVLRGGGGHAPAIGGRGNDLFEDDDAGSRRGAGGVDSDRFDGGPGDDRIDYGERSRSLLVNLGDHHGDGQRGENDHLVRVEDVTAGNGNDVLIGDRVANTLDGGQGSDQVNGGAGNDVLNGGIADFGGLDRIDGGAGDDVISSGDFVYPGPAPAETVVCGTGRDVMEDSDAEDLLGPDCEVSRSSDLIVSIYPIQLSADGRASFQFTCAAPPPRRCTGTLTVAGGRQPFDLAGGTNAAVTVALPPPDVAALRSPAGLAARVIYDGGIDNAGAWTTRLHA